MGNKVTVTFEKEVEYCSLCPYGNTFGPVWDHDCEEEVYEVKCSKLNKKQKENLRNIKDFLSKSDNFLDDLRTILSTRTGENYFAYNKYISVFFVTSDFDIKNEVLINLTSRILNTFFFFK